MDVEHTRAPVLVSAWNHNFPVHRMADNLARPTFGARSLHSYSMRRNPLFITEFTYVNELPEDERITRESDGRSGSLMERSQVK